MVHTLSFPDVQALTTISDHCGSLADAAMRQLAVVL